MIDIILRYKEDKCVIYKVYEGEGEGMRAGLVFVVFRIGGE